MCIIAGYTGKKTAAPILIEMLKNYEYIDGGLSTGIATIHEGKVYMRKVVGDVETLLRETDALSLPGTTGIIHSRTGNDHVEHAHPFMSDDGELALVLNGTTRGGGSPEYFKARDEIMNGFLDCGIKIRSAVFKAKPDKTPLSVLKNGYEYHDTEPYALMIGDKVKSSSIESLGDDIALATREALEALPIDVITLNVHARLPDTITVGNITRPMAIAMGEGECYMSTVPFAIPDEITSRGSVFFTPPTTVLQVTPNGINIRSTSFAETRVEQLDFRTQKEIRLNMEKYLKVGEENAISIYGLPFFTEWNEFWRTPAVDSKYVLEGTMLKPIAPAIYEGLWSFYKEGRLKYKVGTKINSKGKPRKQVQFWLDH